MANRPVGLVTAPEYNEDTFDIGDVKWSARRIPTSGWLAADGSAVSRTTYSDLFAAIVPSLGTFTVTIASPGVFTLANHGLNIGDHLFFTTTGALPTGLSPNTIYYVITVPDANTFTVTATPGGSAINTSGSQSGTHTCWFCPYGLGDGSTTFNLPDQRGRVPVGVSPGGKELVHALGHNDGRAQNLRGISHHHTGVYISSANNHLGTSAGSDIGSTSGDADNTDYPAYLVLNLFVKYA